MHLASWQEKRVIIIIIIIIIIIMSEHGREVTSTSGIVAF